MRLRWYLVIAIVCGAGAWYLATQLRLESGYTRVEFPQVTLEAELADGATKRSQGLSGRESLGDDQGMLFVFDEPDFHYFHMKDMRFPIDIIWLDDDRRVVDITRQLDPSTYPDTVTSGRPAQYVLEVNSGFSDEHRIEVGDAAIIDRYQEDR